MNDIDRSGRGRWAEELACRFLKKNGYKIIIRNYRTPFGEIDIVAKNDEGYILVEVRSRSAVSLGVPEETILLKKRRALFKAAKLLVQKLKIDEFVITFGVLSMVIVGGRVENINFIEDAFGEEEC